MQLPGMAGTGRPARYRCTKGEITHLESCFEPYLSAMPSSEPLLLSVYSVPNTPKDS